MHDARAANLLGAAALTLTDLMLDDVAAAAGVGQSGSAALVVLSWSPGLSVTELGRRVGLSQPAAARMADGLETAGLVQRRAGSGRAVSVHPTRAGRQAARRLLAARSQPLGAVIAELDESDQRALTELLEKILTRLYARVGSADLVCRLCDRAACTDDTACPVGAAERAMER
jgi:MarR family transcriptional repressor of emrRAB